MNAQAPRDAQQRRNRLTLFVILALFFGSMLVAGVLRFADIHPVASRQKGELLEPYGDLRSARLRTMEGAPYAWEPIHRRWRIVVPAPARCDEACRRRARDIGVVWGMLNKDSARVDVLWWCGAGPGSASCGWPDGVPPPQTLHLIAADPARSRLPRVDDPTGLPVYVVDPNGFVVLRYAPRTDLAGLREDITRLLKLK